MSIGINLVNDLIIIWVKVGLSPFTAETTLNLKINLPIDVLNIYS